MLRQKTLRVDSWSWCTDRSELKSQADPVDSLAVRNIIQSVLLAGISKPGGQAHPPLTSQKGEGIHP
jgi:hypothetical protein